MSGVLFGWDGILTTMSYLEMVTGLGDWHTSAHNTRRHIPEQENVWLQRGWGKLIICEIY